MLGRRLTPTGMFAATIALVGLITTGCALAAELRTAGIRVISSDVNARFVQLGVNKAIIIELPENIAEVLVANPKIVNAVVRSKRRVYILGIRNGQTNVYFLGRDHRQIGGLDVDVSDDRQLSPPILANSSIGGKVITVVRGMESMTQTCSETACTQPPPTKTPSNVITSTIQGTIRDAKGNVTGTSSTQGTTTGP